MTTRGQTTLVANDKSGEVLWTVYATECSKTLNLIAGSFTHGLDRKDLVLTSSITPIKRETTYG